MSDEKPDRVLYYESSVEVDIPPFGRPNPDEIFKLAVAQGFKSDANLTVHKLWIHSANKETVVEALTELLSALKKFQHAKIVNYRYGAVYVDSNNWDTLGILGTDPHADKR